MLYPQFLPVVPSDAVDGGDGHIDRQCAERRQHHEDDCHTHVGRDNAYFEKAGIAAELHRKYPTLLKLPDDLNRAIMQEQLAPHRAQETEWERQMLRTEVKHYIEVSDLAYSYNKFYAHNMPDKVAWETLQSDLFANLPQIKAERMPQDFSVVLPKLWRKRQAWDAERTKRPPYRGEER